jgi:recombination protein RecR
MIVPAPLERLIGLLARFPGVGEKTATRLAFFILRQEDTYAGELASALKDARTRIHSCIQCHNISEEEICFLCADTRRVQDTLCVVEGVPDLMAIESTGEFRGLYHVLDGVLAPLKGVGPDDLNFPTLQKRLAQGTIREVIVATSVGVEGEATALFTKRVASPYDVRVTRIASGIPMGGDLEYMDQVTLSRALSGRREL